MQISNPHITGIGGDISITGEIIGDISVGDAISLTFQNSNILVTNAIITILVGQNVLCHDKQALYTINNRDATVEFHRALPSGDATHTEPPISVTNPETPHARILSQYPVLRAKTGLA